jgi:hypothetical protein
MGLGMGIGMDFDIDMPYSLGQHRGRRGCGALGRDGRRRVLSAKALGVSCFCAACLWRREVEDGMRCVRVPVLSLLLCRL